MHPRQESVQLRQHAVIRDQTLWAACRTMRLFDRLLQAVTDTDTVER